MRLKSISCHEDVGSRQSTWSQGVLGLLWTSECHIFVILPHSEWECLLWLPCLIPPISTHVIAGISQLFHKGPDSECVRLCGPHVLCSNNSIVHGSMKAAIENFNGCGCIPVKPYKILAGFVLQAVVAASTYIIPFIVRLLLSRICHFKPLYHLAFILQFVFSYPFLLFYGKALQSDF